MNEKIWFILICRPTKLIIQDRLSLAVSGMNWTEIRVSDILFDKSKIERACYFPMKCKKKSAYDADEH